MANCDAETLTADAKCLCIERGLELRVAISVLCKILQSNDPMATCDAETLVHDARCLCIPEGLQLRVLISVLCRILTLVEEGGIGGVTCGAGVPTAVPATGCGFYLQNNGVVWGYTNGMWNQLIA